MENVSPWLICVGTFCIWPLLAFALGVAIGSGRLSGRLPFRIERNREWRPPGRWGRDIEE